jgi:hypothetical protein
LKSELIHPLPPEQSVQAYVLPPPVHDWCSGEGARASRTVPDSSLAAPHSQLSAEPDIFSATRNRIAFLQIAAEGSPEKFPSLPEIGNRSFRLGELHPTAFGKRLLGSTPACFPELGRRLSEERAHLNTANVSPAMLLTVRWDVCCQNILIFQAHTRNICYQARASERTFVVVV